MILEPASSLEKAVNILSSIDSVTSAEYKFLARRGLQEAEKAYGACPDNINTEAVYALFLLINNLAENSINIYEEKIFPKLPYVNSKDFKISIYLNYALTLHVGKHYEKSLTVIQELHKAINMPNEEPVFFHQKNITKVFLVMVRIYLANEKYPEALALINKVEKRSNINYNLYLISYLSVKLISYFNLNDYENVINTLNKIFKYSKYKFLNHTNIEFIDDIVNESVMKTSPVDNLTPKEQESLQNIKKLAISYLIKLDNNHEIDFQNLLV